MYGVNEMHARESGSIEWDEETSTILWATISVALGINKEEGEWWAHKKIENKGKRKKWIWD